jgi:hypothetical protein
VDGEAFEKHDLPSGGWVAFRDPKQITRRQRKPIDRAQTRLGIAANLHQVLKGEGSAGELADADLDLFEGLMEAVAVTLISEWSFGTEVTADTLGDLRDDDYLALIEAASAHRPVLLPDFTPGPKEDEDGAERPTGLSPESVTISAGETSTTPGSPPKSSPLGGS